MITEMYYCFILHFIKFWKVFIKFEYDRYIYCFIFFKHTSTLIQINTYHFWQVAHNALLASLMHQREYVPRLSVKESAKIVSI